MAEREFSLLCRDRDHAAYQVVGAAMAAVAFLNLEENAKALKTLLAALEEYQRRDGAITDFYNTPKKENANVSSTAAA